MADFGNLLNTDGIIFDLYAKGARLDSLTPNTFVVADANKKLVSGSAYPPVPQTQPYCSMNVIDDLIPQASNPYEGVFPFQAIDSDFQNKALGFINHPNGLLQLSVANGGKVGKYLINWSISLAIDNVNNPTSAGNGEVCLLHISDQNYVYNRVGIGGYYANPPSGVGQSSRYTTRCGSAIIELGDGDFIGLQALRIYVNDLYKYNFTFTAQYISQSNI